MTKLIAILSNLNGVFGACDRIYAIYRDLFLISNLQLAWRSRKFSKRLPITARACHQLNSRSLLAS
ncbi:hypothetical protein HC931_24205 [Candidatus Gracilibacteria bacterium]|nr:hypothetical protein [Candidatus Gracilibacteria bacterium]NJM89685.1 hypothetical protein [Hydrococcus sp. RU_2_2]NJP21615.1 hypothetical protein [Hydrococcus sp. CRU_1_1]NJQ97809.1 hypothetical protein [Hydrococcus sp. CSU_1_8]